MITTLLRAATAAALTILPLTTTTPAHALAPVTVSLSEAVASLPQAAEIPHRLPARKLQALERRQEPASAVTA
ncbi:hypothetical protein ABT010_35665 [Streptomyces sp. NPDC002668]|uniref:hypothetical protein n=1 Tax=Streptomyces sp. NPDC002668 TaxID=3154422 RepID=UPI00333120C9